MPPRNAKYAQQQPVTPRVSPSAPPVSGLQQVEPAPPVKSPFRYGGSTSEILRGAISSPLTSLLSDEAMGSQQETIESLTGGEGAASRLIQMVMEGAESPVGIATLGGLLGTGLTRAVRARAVPPAASTPRLPSTTGVTPPPPPPMPVQGPLKPTTTLGQMTATIPVRPAPGVPGGRLTASIGPRNLQQRIAQILDEAAAAKDLPMATELPSRLNPVATAPAAESLARRAVQGIDSADDVATRLAAERGLLPNPPTAPPPAGRLAGPAPQLNEELQRAIEAIRRTQSSGPVSAAEGAVSARPVPHGPAGTRISADNYVSERRMQELVQKFGGKKTDAPAQTSTPAAAPAPAPAAAPPATPATPEPATLYGKHKGVSANVYSSEANRLIEAGDYDGAANTISQALQSFFKGTESSVPTMRSRLKFSTSKVDVHPAVKTKPGAELKGHGTIEDIEVSPTKSAADWADEMSKLRESKPRPIKKVFGSKGPTPEQLAEYKKQEAAWNAKYRAASKNQKAQLEKDNAAFRAKKGDDTTLGAGFGSLQAFPGLVKKHPMAAARIGSGAAGYAAGGTQGDTPEERTKNAVLVGAASAFLVPNIARIVAGSVPAKAAQSAIYTSVLSSPSSVAKAYLGAYGGAVAAALEHPAQASKIIRNLMPDRFTPAFVQGLKKANAAVGQQQVSKAAPGVLQRVYGAADFAARKAMAAGGIGPDDAARFTLSGLPTTKSGQDVLSTLERLGLPAKLLTSLFPRVGIQILERGAERMGGGLVAPSLRTSGSQAIKTGLGAAAGAAGYAAEDDIPGWLQPFAAAAAGPYTLPVGIGMAARKGYEKGKGGEALEQGLRDITSRLPLPSYGPYEATRRVASGAIAVPNIVQDIAELRDPYDRVPEGFFGGTKAKIPGLRETLPVRGARLNIEGKPTDQGKGKLAAATKKYVPETVQRALTPRTREVNPLQGVDEKVASELKRLDINISSPAFDNTLSIGGKTIKVPPELAEKRRAESREKLVPQIQRAMNSPRYARLDDAKKKLLLQRVIQQAQAAGAAKARGSLLKQLKQRGDL